MSSLVLPGAALIREKEHDTVGHLLVRPVTAAGIKLSKIRSMGAVVLAGAAFALVFVVQGAMEGPVAGAAPLFLAGAALMLFTMTAPGVFMVTIAGDNAAIHAAAGSVAATGLVRSDDRARVDARDHADHHAGRVQHGFHHLVGRGSVPWRRP